MAEQDWYSIGTDVLKDARRARGYSYEAMGRLLHCSSKTYERYEKAGRVPKPMIGLVAEVLDLEITEPERVRIGADGSTPPGEAASLEVQREILRTLESLVASVDALAGRVEQVEARVPVRARRSA